MRTRRTTLAAAVLGATGVMATLTSTAQAAPALDGMALSKQVASASDPGRAYTALSAAQLAAVKDVNDPVSETAETSGISEIPKDKGEVATARCYTARVTYKAKAAAGNVIYTYWQRLNWCHNGSKVTSWKVAERGGETSTPLWSYEGHAGKGSHNVGWEIRSWTQERFKYGFGPVSSTQTPCVQIRGGKGLYSYQKSCNTG